MAETPKRLKPAPETLRELFLKSGNLCAFPNCTALMMNEKGTFIGQVCHIEAAEKGGPRFNPAMTNEQRRAAANLMLMCYEHHKETDDVKKFPASKLRKIKHDHERRFASPDRAILRGLTDWTTADEPTPVKNLGRLVSVLGLSNDDEEIAEAVEQLNEYIERLRLVPIEVRTFIGNISERMRRMRNTAAVDESMSGVSILVSDVRDAFRISDSTIKNRLSQLEAYRLGNIDEIYTDLGPQPAIHLSNLADAWPNWMDIVEFCQATATSLGSFTDDLDFSLLDS